MYKGIKDLLSLYWKAYGGWKDFFRSPYLHFAIFSTLITFKAWQNSDWYEIVFKVIPSLLGFTLGGFAIFISFGNEQFRDLLIARDENEDESAPSLYITVCSTFVHFIIVQMLSLVYSVIYYGWPFALIFDTKDEIFSYINLFFSGFGFLLFLYALFLMLAVTMHIFRIARWFSVFQQKNKPENEK